MHDLHKLKLLFLAIIVVLGLTACSKKEGFSGNIAADDTYYDMIFDWLDATYTYDMYLEQGDSVEVFLEKERGNVSAVIQLGDEEPVYQGDDMAASSFAVNIKQTGNYTVKITGREAKGHISFSRQTGLQ